MVKTVADDSFGFELADRLMHVDVRKRHEINYKVEPWQREQGRIDWKDRCSLNMSKMARGEVTPIYQNQFDKPLAIGAKGRARKEWFSCLKTV